MPTQESKSTPAQRQQLISVLRRPKELIALVCETDLDLEQTLPVLRMVPLHQVRRSVYATSHIFDAWHGLANASTSDEKTLTDLLTILIETVPDLSSDSNYPQLPAAWGEDATSFRATQAHPRAYRGTKYKPPKKSEPQRIDIRPYLCDLSSVQRILASMWRWMSLVKSQLERRGYSRAMIGALEGEFLAASNVPRGRQKRHWTFPPLFVQCIWPFVRWSSPRDVSEFLSLYSELNLEHDAQCRNAISWLLASSGAGLACKWCKVVSVLPAHRRTIFIQSLVHTDAALCEPTSHTAGYIEQISRLASDENFSAWARCFLSGISNGVSEEYLLAGFRTAARFRPDHHFDVVKKSGDFPEQAVADLASKLAEQDSYSGWLAMALWKHCARLPGLADVIRNSQWRSFHSAAGRYFEFLQGIVYEDLSERKLQSKWNAIRKQIPSIEKLLIALPSEHQAKAVTCFADWLWDWNEPAEIEKHLPPGYRLLRRVAAPPFATTEGASNALFSFLNIDKSDLVESFLNTSDASFHALERACVRENDARLISRGCYSLTEFLPEFTVNAFRAAPKKLFTVARVLGGISYPARTQIIRRCQQHSFFQADLVHRPIKEAIAEVAPFLAKGYTNPVSGRLRSWLAGEAKLSIESLERHRRVFHEKLVVTRLDMIEQAAYEWLKRGFPVQATTKNDEHALRLMGSLDDNRRGLRRFLKSYWSGDRDYLSCHPATVSWYDEHPSISRELWEQGIPFCSAGVTLRIERDPLEILKIGAYAGSCLGIGGICAYSAAAVLLDINKQVLYARDRQGKVIGRQLLAISDDNRLICFHIYPQTCAQAVKALFLDYDRTFASALGLPVYDPAEDKAPAYKISNVLSVYWWDDDSWDFDTASK
jgi:hypothetical protein